MIPVAINHVDPVEIVVIVDSLFANARAYSPLRPRPLRPFIVPVQNMVLELFIIIDNERMGLLFAPRQLIYITTGCAQHFSWFTRLAPHYLTR